MGALQLHVELIQSVALLHGQEKASAAILHCPVEVVQYPDTPGDNVESVGTGVGGGGGGVGAGVAGVGIVVGGVAAGVGGVGTVAGGVGAGDDSSLLTAIYGTNTDIPPITIKVNCKTYTIHAIASIN